MRPLTFALMLTASSAFAQEPRPFASYVDASAPVLADPHDLAFGPDGMLYIADKFAHRVAIMDPETLEVTAEIGPGLLPGAHDVSFGPDGKLYVAATGANAVAVYDLGGDAPVLDGYLGPFPRTEGALAHSNGRIYAMASGEGRLYAVEDGALVASAQGMPGAHDVAEAPDGTIWVADNVNRRLVRFDADLQLIQMLDDPKFGFVGPRYMDITPDGLLIVADQDAHRVLKIDPISEEVMGIIGTGEPGLGINLLDDPEGVAVRGNEYFFADSDNNRIVKYQVVLN